MKRKASLHLGGLMSLSIQCSHCDAQHDLTPPPWVLASGRPFRFRCSKCGQADMVNPVEVTAKEGPSDQTNPPPQDPAQEGGLFLRQEEHVYVVRDWATLQQWIAEVRVGPQDEVSESGSEWVKACEHPQLRERFPSNSPPAAVRHNPANTATALPPVTDDAWSDDDTEGIPLGLPSFVNVRPPPSQDSLPQASPPKPPSQDASEQSPEPNLSEGSYDLPSMMLDDVTDAPEPMGIRSQEIEVSRHIREDLPPSEPTTQEEPEPSFEPPSPTEPTEFMEDIEPELSHSGFTEEELDEELDLDWRLPRQRQKQQAAWVAAAAMLLISGGAGAWWWTSAPTPSPTKPPAVALATPAADIPLVEATEPEPNELLDDVAEEEPEPMDLEEPAAPERGVEEQGSLVATNTPPPQPPTRRAATPAPARAPRAEVRLRPPPAPEPVVATPEPAPAPTPTQTLERLAEQGWNKIDMDDSSARVLFRQALTINPNHADSLYGLGYATLNLGNTDEAVVHLCKAMREGNVEIVREVSGILRDKGRTCD